MKRLLIVLSLLLVPSALYAQSTTVSGQVTDAGAQAWNNGTFTFSFVPNPNIPTGPYTWTGGTLQTTISGSLNGTGGYSVSIPSNSAISPIGTQWSLKVCPQASSPCFTTANTTITGATQTLNVTPPTILINLTGTPQPISAYSTSEVTGAVIGSQFYLLGTGLQVCSAVSGNSCTTWAIGGGGGLTQVASLPACVAGTPQSVYLTTANPSIGFYDCVNGLWQARPLADPPLSFSYAIAATGGQAGISEVGNAIDTHIINWQPSASPSVGDGFSYANGDLHTANASWVYQTGTFTVNNNVVYSSSGGQDLAYRSDFTATTNQWAQGAVVLAGSVGTQVAGPCVRVQTGAQTGYCLELGNDSLILAIDNAGSLSTLQNYGAIGVTGDILKIEAIGTTLKVYRNGVCLSPCGVTNAVIASGQIGILGAANSTTNGLSNFQGGIASVCNIQVDSASDSITGPWTSNGVIPSQSCTYPGSFQVSNVRANYVRVNVTSLTGGITLNVTYAGRLAPSLPGTGFSGVSNGISVNAGEVVWTQLTTQGGLGSVAVQTWIRVLLPNGTTYSNGPAGTTIGGCNTGAGPGGVGFGIILPVSGILQSVISQINTPGFPQGTFYVNDYLLTELPTGGVATGTTNSCNNSLAAANPNAYFLTGGVVGSFYPISFTGATSIISSPWSIPGFTATTTVSNPSAGADWTTSGVFSSSARTCIQSISFTLASGSTGVTPVLVLTFNGSKLVYPAATQQGSGTTQTYSFSPGVTAETVTSGSTLYHVVPFNNGQLACFNSGLSTATIGTLTTGINGTTQYSNISILTQVQQDNN